MSQNFRGTPEELILTPGPDDRVGPDGKPCANPKKPCAANDSNETEDLDADETEDFFRKSAANEDEDAENISSLFGGETTTNGTSLFGGKHKRNDTHLYYKGKWRHRRNRTYAVTK